VYIWTISLPWAEPAPRSVRSIGWCETSDNAYRSVTANARLGIFGSPSAGAKVWHSPTVAASVPSIPFSPTIHYYRSVKQCECGLIGPERAIVSNITGINTPKRVRHRHFQRMRLAFSFSAAHSGSRLPRAPRISLSASLRCCEAQRAVTTGRDASVPNASRVPHNAAGHNQHAGGARAMHQEAPGANTRCYCSIRGSGGGCAGDRRARGQRAAAEALRTAVRSRYVGPLLCRSSSLLAHG